jgi:hypothetical protein
MLPDRRSDSLVALTAFAVALFLVHLPVASAEPKDDLSRYTGILLDARHLPEIDRSPAPAIYGPAPDHALLYPDRSHVLSPDEVQEQSVVRYYRTEEDARKGVGGENPLLLKAEAVVGPAHDALRLSAPDMARFQDLDKKLQFTRTWKVGFLVPANR